MCAASKASRSAPANNESDKGARGRRRCAYPARRAFPGEEGNAILDGHVRWKGKEGYFAKLKEMEIGDEVFIQFADSSVKYFEIVKLETVLLAEFPAEALESGGEARMTLITCLGDYDRSLGTSRSRVIATCKEKPEPNAFFSASPLPVTEDEDEAEEEA